MSTFRSQPSLVQRRSESAVFSRVVKTTAPLPAYTGFDPKRIVRRTPSRSTVALVGSSSSPGTFGSNEVGGLGPAVVTGGSVAAGGSWVGTGVATGVGVVVGAWAPAQLATRIAIRQIAP